MKKSFKNRQAEKMAGISKMLVDSSIMLAEIDCAKESGALSPEMAQAEQKLLTLQDILGDVTVTETEFALARKNRGPAWRHFLFAVVLFGGMLGGVYGMHRQRELDNPKKANLLFTVAMALGGLATYHSKRACDFQIEYHNACAEYLKQYQAILQRARDINMDLDPKVK